MMTKSNARHSVGDPVPDPSFDPLLGPGTKGFPHTHAPLRASEVGQQGWNVLAGDLPFPIALLKREALEHNIAWMQQRVDAWGIAFAPHGKTTMSPELFRRQLDAGAWGISFANVTQLAIGAAAGVRRALIANQVMAAADLAGIRALRQRYAGLRVVFLVDSLAQLAAIEAWGAANGATTKNADESADENTDQTIPGNAAPFEVLLELGLSGGRTGCRTEAEALTLAARLHASSAVRFVGLECYEGLWAKGRTDTDQLLVDTLMDRVDALARACIAEGWFDTATDEEILLSAGGSAVFDLVAGRLRPALGRPVRGLLRSGCYLAHDHGTYAHMQSAIDPRIGCPAGDSLRAALEVWALVQSRPEPGLAILGAGKRDVSYDLSQPVPIARAAAGSLQTRGVPQGWRIDALNDQHAYLRWNAADAALAADAPVVGERIGLGISHPCTTFDKWHWMPVVGGDFGVSDAVTMRF